MCVWGGGIHIEDRAATHGPPVPNTVTNALYCAVVPLAYSAAVLMPAA